MARHRFDLAFGPRPTLDFEISGTHVSVVACAPNEAPFLEAAGKVDNLVLSKVRETVTVRLADQKGSFWFKEPPHRLFLHVPADLRARFAVDMGQLDLKGLRGCDLTATTNAGQLELTDVRGRLQLEANAGKLVGDRIGGTLSVKAGAGAVRLYLVQLDEGVHRVHSSMGSVRIELPPGVDVRLESKTVMGSTRTKYPSNPDSPRVLKLEAELGSVKVLEGNAYADPFHGDAPDWRRRWKDDAAWQPVNEAAPAAAAPRAPAPPPARATSAEELRRILSMVEQKTISAHDAERLIRALDGR